MAGSIFIILFLITLAVARFASQRYQAAVGAGRRIPMPSAQTAGEAAREFLDANDGQAVQIMEHNALISDYYDPKRRTLFFTKATMLGTDAASWAIALHETAHALQTGEGLKALQWRIGSIQLTRYAPAVIGVVFLLLVFLNRPLFRVLPMVFAFIMAAIMAMNVMSLPIEFNASVRARAWLEGRLRKNRQILEMMGPILQGVAFRDTAVFLKSPKYLFFTLLPLGGRKRPN